MSSMRPRPVVRTLPWTNNSPFLSTICSTAATRFASNCEAGVDGFVRLNLPDTARANVSKKLWICRSLLMRRSRSTSTACCNSWPIASTSSQPGALSVSTRMRRRRCGPAMVTDKSRQARMPLCPQRPSSTKPGRPSHQWSRRDGGTSPNVRRLERWHRRCARCWSGPVEQSPFLERSRPRQQRRTRHRSGRRE